MTMQAEKNSLPRFMKNEEKCRRLRLLCVVVARALPDLSPADRIACYEALALVLPDKRHAERAAFTAFALATAEAAQSEMNGLLRTP